MGFLKNIVKSVTGSWAEVSLETQRMTPGLSRKFNARVKVADQAIEVSQIIAEVECIERAEVRESHSSSDDNSFGRETHRASATVYEKTIVLADAPTLRANDERSFEFTVEIPIAGPFSFNGKHVEIQWRARVSLDMKGNDPDSGWEVFEVG